MRLSTAAPRSGALGRVRDASSPGAERGDTDPPHPTDLTSPDTAAVKTAVITAMVAAAIAAMEAAPISAAMVIARAPIDAATVAISAIVTAAAAIITAAVVRRAVVAPGIERRDVTGGRVDAGLITTGKRDRERCNDCAQKNPTANHGFSPSPI
jgi:hypothetical protein